MSRYDDLGLPGLAAARWFGFACAVSGAAVVIAVSSQHLFGMQPCAWCVLIRLVFVLIAILALAGILVYARPVAMRVVGALGLALAASGVAASLWQHFVAARAGSCNLTLADRLVGWTTLDTLLPSVFEARASCAEAAVDLYGIPYDLWALGGFVLVGIFLARAVALVR